VNALPTILVYGVGNPGREDDGLGVRFAEWVADTGFPGVSVDTNYQLNVEDALTISRYDIVVFADASVNKSRNFRLSALEPAAQIAFTTHAMAPGSVLAFCHDLYAKYPASFLLEILGCRWGFAEGLSRPAKKRLTRACEFMAPLLEKREVNLFAKAAGCRFGRPRNSVRDMRARHFSRPGRPVGDS
jgi:hydrogenase maturation protease